MKLKTLKDIEVPNKELETFRKDLKKEGIESLEEGFSISSQSLREAAIKAVKQWLSKIDLKWSIKDGKFTFEKMPLQPGILVTFGSIGAFVWFFNIIEEELETNENNNNNSE